MFLQQNKQENQTQAEINGSSLDGLKMHPMNHKQNNLSKPRVVL
jgi:hypothetical protein